MKEISSFEQEGINASALAIHALQSDWHKPIVNNKINTHLLEDKIVSAMMSGEVAVHTDREVDLAKMMIVDLVSEYGVKQ